MGFTHQNRQARSWYSGQSPVSEADVIRQRTFNQTASLFIPMTGVTDSQFKQNGEFREQAAGQTGNYTTTWAVGNQHVYIDVTALTGSGPVVVTGVKIHESTAIPVAGFTETIQVDQIAMYQTDAKWYEVTSIDVSGLTAVTYDLGALGYIDFGNKNVSVMGLRAEFRPAANTGDVTLYLLKVDDLGDKKVALKYIERLGFDSTAGNGAINDHIRSGDDDRSFTASVNLAEANNMMVLKCLNYETYFTDGRSMMFGAIKNEGLIVGYEGDPLGSGISGMDHVTISFYFRFI